MSQLLLRHVVLSHALFDTADLLDKMGQSGAGAVASFVGHVRGDGAGGHALTALELEHYPGKTEQTLMDLADEMAARWPLMALAIHHRVGKLLVGAPIVLIAAASSHRAAALEAVDFAMDTLKNGAFLWKKEHRADGSTAWVEARTADAKRAARWQ